MLAEDQYYIGAVDVTMCRGFTSIVEERHLKTPEDYVYYKVDERQTRYVVGCVYGNSYLPAKLYMSPIKHECYFASGLIRPTRQYKRGVDNTYFRFFDDAEEVKNNIIVFLKWLRKVPTLNLKRMKEKAIMETWGHLIRDVHPTQEWMTRSKLTFDAKRRDELSQFQRHLADERDLIPEDS